MTGRGTKIEEYALIADFYGNLPKPHVLSFLQECEGAMSASKPESEKIMQLASEGKRINRIQADYFPHLTYGDIQAEIGGQNALGMMRMITGRINALAASDDPALRTKYAHELKNLTKLMYSNHKTSHDKLTQIREALDA